MFIIIILITDNSNDNKTTNNHSNNDTCGEGLPRREEDTRRASREKDTMLCLLCSFVDEGKRRCEEGASEARERGRGEGKGGEDLVRGVLLALLAVRVAGLGNVHHLAHLGGFKPQLDTPVPFISTFIMLLILMMP